MVGITADDGGMLVRADVARVQLEAETSRPGPGPSPISPWQGGVAGEDDGGSGTGGVGEQAPKKAAPTRYHGTVALDATRVGRDASRIAEEVIVHLSALVGSRVTVTLEIEAEVPSGASEQVVRTVTENARTLKFDSQGFEQG